MGASGIDHSATTKIPFEAEVKMEMGKPGPGLHGVQVIRAEGSLQRVEGPLKQRLRLVVAPLSVDQFASRRLEPRPGDRIV